MKHETHLFHQNLWLNKFLPKFMPNAIFLCPQDFLHMNTQGSFHGPYKLTNLFTSDSLMQDEMKNVSSHIKLLDQFNMELDLVTLCFITK
jgi:hypothetical protein